MRLPLNLWRLHAKNLPGYLADGPQESAFSLPGADALDAFSDLIGACEENEAAEEGAAYALAGLFEEELEGELSLTRQIDFGALSGDRAVLTFEHIAGRGEILLGGKTIARFDDQADQTGVRLNAFEKTGMPCGLFVDVTDVLLVGRSEKLELRFDDTRPAGVCGAAFLSTSACAHLSRVSIQPDAQRRTMTVRARVSAQHAGRYAFRVQAVPPETGAAMPPARETEFALEKGEEKIVMLSMEASAGRFALGQSYAAPAVRIQLLLRGEKARGDGLLCDDELLLCGYGGGAPKYFLPLTAKASMGDEEALCSQLRALHVPAVCLSVPAPDGLYRALCRAGIACMQHVSEALRPAFTRYPCLTLCDAPLPEDNLSPEAAAWQMAGSVAFPRSIDESLTPEEMLLEVSGRQLERSGEGVRAALSWLRAVQIRLRAEAARQGRYQGALCSAQEAADKDIQDAIETALRPVHLSMLPLSGAWWTLTRFSASLEAFIPQTALQAETVCAIAVLEDEEGNELARMEAPCKRSGYIGVIEALLPDSPCVLTLHGCLMRGDAVLEESTLPVYVGSRGVLEAAF